MKFIFLAVALSCLSLVVTKPLDDVGRKCIVKYLSDKELLDSSFVVDPVLPDNCDEFISAKIFDIYFEIIYGGIKPEEDDWSEVYYILKRNGVADVVLKSLLYDEESKEAKEIQETVIKMRKIADMMDSWKNKQITDNVVKLKIKRPDSETELCLKSYVTSEVLSTFVGKDRSEQLENYDIEDLECDKLITSFKKQLEVELLETLPKLNTDKENICMKNAYANSNMTQKYSDIFTLVLMKDINVDDVYHLYISYCYNIAAFYEMTLECARLGFILKDVLEVRNVYSIDFTKEESLFSNNYKENFEIIVKFNENRSLNEFLIIADEMSQVKNNSQCFIDHLNNFKLSEMFLKVMAAEDNYEVDRIIAMKKLMREMLYPIKVFCKMNNDNSKMFDDMLNDFRTNEKELPDVMNCFQEFITEEIVNGITYFKVNMDGQLNGKKCERVVDLLDEMEKSFNTDPQDICLLKAFKNLKFFKKMLRMTVLAEMGISPQQKAEERINFNVLLSKAIELQFKCQKETFDLI